MTTAVLEPERCADDELPGDLPSRLRLKVSDTSGNNQLSLIWGLRSRYYDSATTAALFYEAEALTPINGAAVTGLSGASGGDVVTIKSLPAASWVTMLSTTISATTGNLTHQGSYRVWARCYSATGTPQFQFLWGVGSLSVPVANDSVTLPASGGFYLLDLGVVRIDYPQVGTNEWLGAVRVYSAGGGDSASVDCLYLQPLDDGAGQLTYVYEPPASSISTTLYPTTGTSVTGYGTYPWSTPDGIISGGGGASVSLPIASESYFLEATGFGFSLPSGVTIQGIEVLVTGNIGGTSYDCDIGVVNLVKAGTILTGFSSPQNGAVGAGTYGLTPETITYGSPTDLWGTTWAYGDINNSGFGAAIGVGNGFITSSVFYVTAVQMTVYYSLGTGFLVSQDAVIYANSTMEVRYDEMVREAPGGTVYGKVSQVVGDLARMPPSGMENRPCQIFIKPSRGDLNTLPDSGLDGFTCQPIVRPSWIFRP